MWLKTFVCANLPRLWICCFPIKNMSPNELERCRNWSARAKRLTNHRRTFTWEIPSRKNQWRFRVTTYLESILDYSATFWMKAIGLPRAICALWRSEGYPSRQTILARDSLHTPVATLIRSSRLWSWCGTLVATIVQAWFPTTFLLSSTTWIQKLAGSMGLTDPDYESSRVTLTKLMQFAIS